MNTRQPSQAGAKPWVEWCANRIDDPVSRLKFLQTVTPLRPLRKRRRISARHFVLAAAVLLAGLASLFLARSNGRIRTVAAAAPLPRLPRETTAAPSNVWLVDKSADSETFSNGLRINTQFETTNHPRSYLAFPAGRPDDAAVRRDQPAGIVFHTTESRQAPFEANQNTALKQIGESLLEFVRRKQAYHFLIDRFGRVYRIVPESDAANHAGYSVWSDADWIYLNLNESFLGVSFETETEPGQSQATISPAQLHSAGMLTEMLRNRYSLPPGNCVTHAQVSVNPGNMRVGYHTDWASSFPFAQLGLPDNYAVPLPALAAFGFEYDSTFVHWAGTRLYAGVELAEQKLARRAADAGVSVVALRGRLRQQYRRKLAAVRARNSPEEASENR